jgi:effector-binding domain-containing protein
VGVSPDGPAIGFYEIRPDGLTASVGFVVEEPYEGDGTVVSFDLPRCQVVTGVHVGPYDHLPAAYEALREAAVEQGCTIDESEMWEEYLTGPDTPPEQTRTRISWPLQDPVHAHV